MTAARPSRENHGVTGDDFPGAYWDSENGILPVQVEP